MKVEKKDKKCRVPVTDLTRTDRKYSFIGTELKLKPDDDVDEQIFMEEEKLYVPILIISLEPLTYL